MKSVSCVVLACSIAIFYSLNSWALSRSDTSLSLRPLLLAQNESGAPVNAAKPAAEKKAGGEGKEVPTSGSAKGAENGDSSEAEGSSVPALKGDVLKLKNGKVLEGIQVIRSTPKEYQVEVTNGEVPISIPRGQVESVIYDDVEPVQTGHGGETLVPEHPVSIPGTRLAPGLENKLNTDLSRPPLQYKQTDLVTILDDLAKRLGVKIVIDPSVRSLKPSERLWTVDAKKGTTLLTLLNTDFSNHFPNLVVQYQFDKVVILTKEAANKQASSGRVQNPSQENIPSEGAPANTSLKQSTSK